MRACLDGSASTFPIDRPDCFFQSFLACCFPQKADLCLPRIGNTSRTELVSAVAPSGVVAAQSCVQNAFDNRSFVEVEMSSIPNCLPSKVESLSELPTNGRFVSKDSDQSSPSSPGLSARRSTVTHMEGDVKAAARDPQSTRVKLRSILIWFRILRAHYHWPLFEAIRYALWLSR